MCNDIVITDPEEITLAAIECGVPLGFIRAILRRPGVQLFRRADGKIWFKGIRLKRGGEVP